MKTRTAEQFIKSGFVVVYNAPVDKFSFANAVIETTLDSTDDVNEMFVHNIARTHFGAKEGNSARVTKKAIEIHSQIEVENIMTQEPEIEEVVEAEAEVVAEVTETPAEADETEVVAEETVEAEVAEVVEAEAVAPKAFTGFGWGAAPKRDLIERVKDAVIAAGAEVEQVVSESDVADDDEPVVIHNRKPTDRDSKFAIMDEVIAANPELNCSAALVALAEEVYGGEMFAEAGKKYWMNKRLEAAGRTPDRGGSRGKKEKAPKAHKVPAYIQMLIEREVGEGAIVTGFDQDSLVVNAELNGQAYVVTFSVSVSAPEVVVDGSDDTAEVVEETAE
jgi:hypothetical protein